MRDSRLPPSGTTLVGNHRGVEHRVVVNERTFTYDGRTFGSLSAAARHITNNSVNGYLFFGLGATSAPAARAPRAVGLATATGIDTGKCKTKGCYNDAVCNGGFCLKHFSNPAAKRSYSSCQSPRTAEHHMGLEIECYAGDEESHRGLLGQDTVPHHDGSLPVYGCEFKLLGTPAKLMKNATTLARRIAAAGGRVSKTCGLHVHIDARTAPHIRRANFIEWLKTWEEFWFGLVPPSRRDNRYCHRLTNRSSDRYGWVTSTRHNTIEVRIHPGSLCPHKIRGWLEVCKGLMELLHSGRTLETPVIDAATGRPSREFLTGIFNTEAMEYLDARLDGDGVITSVSAEFRREEVG